MTLFLRIVIPQRIASPFHSWKLIKYYSLGSVQGIGKKMLIFSAKRFESLDGLFSFFFHGNEN